MPVMSCKVGAKPGYKYGDSGKCYTYTRGNETSRKRAKKKAFIQGAAIEASKARSGKGSGKVKEIEDEMSKDEDLKEFDDSINDWMSKIQSSFEKQFSSAGEFMWISDYFDDYVVAKKGEQHYEISFSEEKDGSILFDTQEKWLPVKLSYVAEMVDGAFLDLMMIYEFKGKSPEIPLLSDIDLKALTSMDPDPKFVTLPVGRANVKSANHRFYSEAFIKELEAQIRTVKPIGLMGHLRKEDEATQFPSEAVHWVGVLREGDVLWGKGYLPPGEARDRILRYQATSKKIATSIYAKADGVWNPERDAYDMKEDTLELKQIDIAPADRAGIADLAAIPMITAEMIFSEEEPEEQEMSKEQVIRELTAEDAALLPEAVKQAVLRSSQFEPQIREALDIDETVDAIKTVKELKQQSVEQEKRAVSGRIDELLRDPEKGIKLESVRDLVAEMVKSRNPATVEEAETIVAEIISSEAVTKVLSSTVQETMGPPQRAPITPQSSGKSSGKFFEIPKES